MVLGVAEMGGIRSLFSPVWSLAKTVWSKGDQGWRERSRQPSVQYYLDTKPAPDWY